MADETQPNSTPDTPAPSPEAPAADPTPQEAPQSDPQPASDHPEAAPDQEPSGTALTELALEDPAAAAEVAAEKPHATDEHPGGLAVTPDPNPSAPGPSATPDPAREATGVTSAGAPPSPQAEQASPASPATTGEPLSVEATGKPRVKAILVNQFTRRSDEDALLGQWVDVVAGEYEGRKGAYVDDDSHDEKTGYPERVLVRTRDEHNELIVVDYADIRPSSYTGGR